MTQTTEETVAFQNEFSQENLEYKIEIATQTLERNIGFVANCDNKTSIVLAAVGVFLTIILTNDGLNKIFDIIKSCIVTRTFCNVLYLICFAISVFVMAFGMFNLCSVLIAKTSESATGLTQMNSRIFFSGIRNNGDYENYHDKFCTMSRQELLDEVLAQIYINADIATQKYKKYNAGFKFTIIGFLSFVTILLIGIYLY